MSKLTIFFISHFCLESPREAFPETLPKLGPHFRVFISAFMFFLIAFNRFVCMCDYLFTFSYCSS